MKLASVTVTLIVFDPYSFSFPQTKGTPPKKRYGHTAVLWRHYIIIFGELDLFGMVKNSTG
jgi:hypothetical protein